MQISVLQAVLLGIACACCSSGTVPLGWMSLNIMSRPIIHSFLIGLIMGDMQTAMIIGCTIQALYLGATSIGGVASMPQIGISLWYALPIAMASGLPTEEAAALTLTICLACAPIWTVVGQFVNVAKIAILHTMDAMVHNGKLHQANVLAYIAQNGIVFIQAGVSVILLNLLGQQVIIDLAAALPAWVSGSMTIFTSILRVLGFTLLLTSLMKNKAQWLLFMFGFALVKSAGFSVLTLTFVGLGLAYIVFLCSGSKSTEMEA